MFFPHYTGDYFEFDNQQNFTASINYDDDGPEEFASCTITTVDANAKTAQIQVKGDFFNLNYVPVSSTKDFSVTSTTLTSSSEWTVAGAITRNVKQGQLTLKGPNVQNTLPIPLNVCTLVPPPKPKPAAPKTSELKADEKRWTRLASLAVWHRV